ncbi:hypothetical protein MC885_013735 [Smutsia gigantea]|nr:hypothetical protein MC885_013735 [Smutsia gigantea]
MEPTSQNGTHEAGPSSYPCSAPRKGQCSGIRMKHPHGSLPATVTDFWSLRVLRLSPGAIRGCEWNAAAFRWV